MARPGWYNENCGRDFPFVFSRSDTDPDAAAFRETPDVVVDFGCVVGAHSDFVEGEHSIWLQAIEWFGNYVEFIFHSDAPGLAGHKLSFTRELSDDDYEIEYAEAINRSESSLSVSASAPDVSHCSGDLLWEGFLVTKNISKLPQTATVFGDELTIEPGLIQSLGGHYMSTLSVFNANRTRAERPTGCREWCWPDGSYTAYGYFAVAACLTGDIRFAEGYNCFIEEDRYTNKLTIHAEVGQGLGEPCEELQQFLGEDTPEFGSYYDGSLGCEEVIRTVNGIEGPHLEIVGGQGVTVETYPDEHLILVKVDMQDLAGCYEPEASTSLDLKSINPDPCDCGEA